MTSDNIANGKFSYLVQLLVLVAVALVAMVLLIGLATIIFGPVRSHVFTTISSQISYEISD